MTLERIGDGPVLEPVRDHAWEQKAVYNPGAVFCEADGHFHLLYRAVGEYHDYVGRLGHAVFALDARRRRLELVRRDPEPVFSPELLDRWGVLEAMDLQGRRLSTEDARITAMRFGKETRYWMTVVIILDPLAPTPVRRREGGGLEELQPNWQARTLLTEVHLDDAGLRFSHDPADYHLITPPELSDKDVVPFPRRIDGRIRFLDRRVPVGREENPSSENRPCIKVADLDDEAMRLGPPSVLLPTEGAPPWEARKNGAGLPPILTEAGWLVIYHGVDDANVYRTGASLLDRDDIFRICGRSPRPILAPERDYETTGDVPDVTFATGGGVIDDTLVVFYGCADKYCGAASAPLDDLLQATGA